MRDAKQRKRIERAAAMTECGRVVTTGCMGDHDIRLLAWPDDGLAVALIVDGAHKRARTLRGVWRIIAAMVARRMV
jgi:hypothetical protein